jgi:hypothetical protein
LDYDSVQADFSTIIIGETAMKKTLGIIIVFVGFALLALNSRAASAAGQDGVLISKDGRTVFTTRTSSPRAAETPESDDNLVKIYDNIGTAYPKGTYNCCQGAVISGSQTEVEWWGGVAFTPRANRLVTKIKIAIGYNSGTNEVFVNLNSDSAGVPGAPIKTWKVKNISGAGSCCAVTTVVDKAGIAVTAGVRYWVTVTTNGSDKDAFLSWNVNDTNQVDPALNAARCKGTLCREDDGKWVAVQQTPGLALAVLGR